MNVARRRRPHALLVLGLCALAACHDGLSPAAPGAPPPQLSLGGASVVVNSLADPGDGSCEASECTLREAIGAVDAGGAITFSVTGTILLTAGELAIGKPLSITGPGASALVVDAGGASRVALVRSAGAVDLVDIGIAHGRVDGPGGCIQNEGSTLRLTRVVVAGCTSWGAGGGLGNTGYAGTPGQLRLDRVTVRDSWAANGGGGIYNNHDGTLTIEASTVSGNEGREGGGVGTTGYATIRSSTFSSNRARFHGGGIYAADRSLPGMDVAFSTIVNNVSDADNNGDGDGGGIYNSQGTFILTGSIVAGNGDSGGQAPDCGSFNPQVATGGRNLIQDLTGCGAYATTAVVSGVSPLVGPLADNGGPTRTHALLVGSPAIDAAGTPCPATDQRGVSRPRGTACDIGAFEVGIDVAIDVRPGSTDNTVSLKIGGLLPVAVLSSATVDASLVNVATARINNVGAAKRTNGTYLSSLEDVNADGRVDLVLFFEVSKLGLRLQTTSLTLRATLTDGRQIQGTDAIRVVK
jgi:CSLREA domain-containing protein